MRFPTEDFRNVSYNHIFGNAPFALNGIFVGFAIVKYVYIAIAPENVFGSWEIVAGLCSRLTLRQCNTCDKPKMDELTFKPIITFGNRNATMSKKSTA